MKSEAHKAANRRYMAKYRLTAIGKISVVRGNRKHRSENKLKLLAYRGGKCVDCGFSGHYSALEFDHVRGTKSFTIAASGVAQRWDVIAAEADKCDIRCATCHAIRTCDPVYHAQDPLAELYCG